MTRTIDEIKAWAREEAREWGQDMPARTRVMNAIARGRRVRMPDDDEAYEVDRIVGYDSERRTGPTDWALVEALPAGWAEHLGYGEADADADAADGEGEGEGEASASPDGPADAPAVTVEAAEVESRIRAAREAGTLPRCGCCMGEPHGLGLVAAVLRVGEGVAIQWRRRPAFEAAA